MANSCSHTAILGPQSVRHGKQPPSSPNRTAGERTDEVKGTTTGLPSGRLLTPKSQFKRLTALAPPGLRLCAIHPSTSPILSSTQGCRTLKLLSQFAIRMRIAHALQGSARNRIHPNARPESLSVIIPPVCLPTPGLRHGF
ncbi:hypothetical protein BJX68DRAFT_226213 [Aspergillus pseudodeflectus]|uniref:Uncharacterized protein n=1 Tax=Aspergillus pseudodeflectus TaxID=176178 RepID=A0ABR4L4F9_9EURO